MVLIDQGMKPIRVAQALGVSPAAVTRWKQAWQKGGEKALAAKPHPGGKAWMTAAQQADLAQPCGRYACSTEAVDALVDLSSQVEGVIGAQLAGAGLGGSMMILVRREAVDRLMHHLRKDFYEPRGLDFGARTMTPVAGAGILAP